MKLFNRQVRKLPMFALLATSVCAGPLAHGAWIDDGAAMQAASSFLGTSTGCSVLPDRTVESVIVRGSLWVAVLSPSGHVIVSGSDKATPIVGFSENDFSEGEEDSPERAAIDAANAAVAAAEADETKGRHARWEKIMGNGESSFAKAAEDKRGTGNGERAIGSGVRRLRLLASSGTGVNIEPFITSRYNQCQPWNDMTPVVSKDTDAYYRGRSLAGCVSVADAALLRAVRWPVYPARTDTVTHSFRGGTFDIRFDGSAPFKWDLMQDTYPVSGDLRGRLAEDVRYEIGHFMMWLNHSARMTYNAGESTSTKYNAAHGGERDWYTIGRNMVPTAEGVEDIVTTTLAAGIPVFVGVGGHAVVADGWKTEDDEAYVDLVYGWGGAGTWYSVESGPVKYFWVEHYPRAKPQLDPIPRVIGESVTLSWHFPDCYTNSLYMFYVTGKRRTSAVPKTWTADFSDASTGSGYPDGVWTTYDFGDGSVALDAMDLTYGFYQFSTPLTITENSVLSLNVRGGGYNSGDANSGNVVIEICGDDGNWRELFVPECNWSFWPGSWKPNSCSLADYAGQTVQLRIYKRHTTYNGRVDIGDFKVTNVIPLEGDIIAKMTAAADRSITLENLQPGSDYSFTVMPYLYGALVTGETSDAKIASVAATSLGMPEFTSIQYAANGNSAQDLTDGYLADGSIGSSTLYVACSDAVTNLTATPSHLTLVSNETVHVSQLNDGRWRITFDPSIPENRNRQRMILTLHATDLNGTTIHRDIVMRMTADSGIEGGAEVDDDIMLYTPKARPIAVWNGDFNGATTRGAVTFNAQGNTIAEDGSTITKKAGEKGIDFAIAGGGTSILGIAGGKNISKPPSGSAIIMATASVSTNAATAVSWSDGGKFRLHEGAKSGQYYTASDVVQIDSALHSLGLLTTASGSKAYFDGSLATENSNPKLTSAVSGITLGGWRDSSLLEMANAAFSHIAIFTNATASADDVFNWNLKNMTGAVTVPASGGSITTLDTGRNLGINLNGGHVALDEPIYAAALFVQADTTLEVPMGFGISGSRVLYVAPGKALTVDVVCDGTALSNAVAAAGGVYTSRILQGANYGDIVAGSLPDIGSRYTVEFVQVDTEGVYFRVTDTRALEIYNDDGSDIPVGYVTDGGKSCIITNATGLITIPAMMEQVNIYAKDDVLNFKVAAGASPSFVIYASNVAGGVEIGGGFGLNLTPLFAELASGDNTTISLSLNPVAVYNGVKVRPEFDATAVDLLSFSGTGDGRKIRLPTKIIPGLWYCVDYADNVRFTNANSTDPVSVTTTGTTNTTLSAPAVDANTFYRVRVGASKAAVSTQ